MSKKRSTVYIPLVEPMNQLNFLLEIYSETESFGKSVLKALTNHFNITAIGLNSLNQYPNALQAVYSVQKLGLKIPFFAL